MTEAVRQQPSDLERAAELIGSSRRMAVMAHVNPDADAIGATLGLALGLQAAGKDAIPALSDPVPEYAGFLQGAETIVSTLPADLDLLICVDSADIERVGALYLNNLELFRRLNVLNLDHHRTNPNFGTVNYVDPAASSSSELCYDLLRELGALLNPDVANALLFGIVGDTGSFQNGATTPGSLRVAADLLSRGADSQRIAFQLFERKRFVAARLWGRVVGSIDLDARRGIVFGYLSQDMLAEEGVTMDETEGIPEYLRGIVEAEVVMLLKETEEGDIRVSMRSRPAVDVAAIAKALDGGGHRQAAGCTVPGPVSAARELLVATYDRTHGGA